MRNLISFLIKHSVWILTVFYVIVSAVLLFRFNAYQQSVFFSSANQVSGWVYSLSGNITGYFGLRQINRYLQERNGFLEMEVARLKRVLESDDYKTLAEYASKDTALSRYNFQVAQVINNSVMRPANYITINKGSDDGIRTEMGVIDRNGVVGKVDIVGKNFSRVISLLNPKWRLSFFGVGWAGCPVCGIGRVAPARRFCHRRYDYHQRILVRFSRRYFCGNHQGVFQTKER